MAAKGFKEKVLIPALREHGLSVRQARARIDDVFNCINNALQRHEPVEVPIGTFTVRPRTGQKRARKFGKIVTMPDYSIDFQPCAELILSAAAAPPSPPRPTRTKHTQVPVKSDLTTSTELLVEFVRGNVEAGNWALFFNELRNPLFAPALMKRSRPEANEFRSLDEATLVIDECAPDEMPEDSWDQLAACHEWFARWTQRVIPHAVWQQAMHTAEKTLMPDT